MSIEKYYLLFLIYSVAGWIIEEIYCSYCEKKIVNRGFLLGPVCPIYGIGSLTFTILLTRLYCYPVLIFIISFFSCALIEYFTSYILEKIFKARWWDYSDKKINLNGRICLENLIPFGIFGLLVIYVLNPFFVGIFDKIGESNLTVISIVTAVILVIDIIVSFIAVARVTITAKVISRKGVADNTNEITKGVKEELRKTFTGRRLINAFPNLQAFGTKVKQLAQKTVEKANEIANETKEKGGKIIEETKKAGIKIKNASKKNKEKNNKK